MADTTTVDKFKGAVGDGKGLDLPTYDAQKVGIVINRTANAVMVHESLGLPGRLAGLGTGKVDSDAISVYSIAEFNKKYPKPGETHVTLDQYKKDAERLAPLVVTTGRGNTNVEIALDMQTRVREIGVDYQAFKDKLKLMTDVVPKAGVDTTLKIESPYPR
jgi:hypothetical protein